MGVYSLAVYSLRVYKQKNTKELHGYWFLVLCDKRLLCVTSYNQLVCAL